MSIPVRQSTAFECSIGPVLDADGVAVTGGVVGDFKIKKTTGDFAALNGSATLTHVSAGIYDLVLTASDLDTVGLATIAIDDTTNACQQVRLQVMEEAIYDALYAASANAFTGAAGSTKVTGVVLVDTLTTYTSNTPQTGDSFAIVNSGTHGNAALLARTPSATSITNMNTVFATDFAANYNTTNDGWVVKLGDYAHGGSSAALTLDALTINDSVTLASVTFDSITVTNTTTLSGAVVATNASNDIRGIGSFTTAGKAEINAEVDAAIETYHLDHLFATAYDPASKPGAADALLNEIVESDAGVSRFTANSLALAPTGGSAPTVEQIRTEMDDNSTKLAAIVEDTGTTLPAAITAAAGAVTLANGAHGGSASDLTLRRIIVASTANQTAVSVTGSGTGAGMTISGGTEGNALNLLGGLTSGAGLQVISFGGAAVVLNDWTGAGNGVVELISDGGKGSIYGDLTGTVTGISGTITTLDQLDTAQDTQHGTTRALIPDIYHADISLCIDEANTQDEWTVLWYKNGVRQTSVTSGKIQVIKRADGTDLIAADTAMTQIASTGSWKYDATTTARTTAGEAVLVVVEATIDGSERTYSRVLTRDSTAP